MDAPVQGENGAFLLLDRKPVVWFFRVLSKPPDQGLLDQPIAHHRRRKEIDIFWRRSCTVEDLMNVKEKRQLS